MDQDLNKITIAALLHDIGKVIEKSLTKEQFDKEKDSWNTKVSHSHYGVDYLKNTLNLNTPFWDDVLAIIQRHHVRADNTDHNKLAYQLSGADVMSAAHDRRYRIENLYFNKGVVPQELKRTPLLPTITFLKKKHLKLTKYYNVLNYNKQFPIPIDIPENNTAIEQSENFYLDLQTNLQETFLVNLDKIQNLNYLLNILEKFTYWTPSTVQKNYYSDISLYDHSKTTAAFASAKHIYASTPKSSKEKTIFTLLKCDFSGIQNFIYTISNDEALKTLRAKSFYIEFLVEYIADTILNKFDLSRANLMSTCGGSFFLLLPNIKEVEEYIYKIEQEINDWLFEKFGNVLYISFTVVSTTPKALQTKIIEIDKIGNKIDNKEHSIKQVWLNLSQKLNTKKHQKYINQLGKLFEPQETGKQCKICRCYRNEELDKNICSLCGEFIKFGGKLFNHEVLITINTDDAKDNFIHLKDGSKLPIPKISGVDKYDSYFIYNAEIGFNKENFGHIPLRLNTYYLKTEKNSPVEFKDLGDLSTGTDRLAVLRMDVDNLGQVFTSDDYLDDYFAGFTRYHTISRTVNDFFKRYVHGICSGKFYEENSQLTRHDLSGQKFAKEDQHKYKRKVNVIYSGGDDLMVIGTWDDIVELAFDIQEAFKLYTCGALNISAAITLHNSTYPVHLMAASSLKALDYAKTKKSDSKGHLVLFGEQKGIGKGKPYYMVFNWKEAEDVKEYLKQVISISTEADNKDPAKIALSRNFIRSVYLHICNYLHKDDNENNRLELIPLVWLLGRQDESISKKLKDNAKATKLWSDLKKDIYNEQEYKKLEATFAWLLLLTRKSETGKGDNNG